MRLGLRWLGLILVFAMASCDHGPSPSEVREAKAKMIPVVALLNSYFVSGRPLPETREELMRAYSESEKSNLPEDVGYILMKSGDCYKLYGYVWMRTRLWYISKSSPGEYPHQGWWFDDDNGSPFVAIPDE
jgi:hypothetical protein